MSFDKTKVEQRLLANRSIDPATGCWTWTLYKRHDGYGLISVRRNNKRVNLHTHRVAYEVFVEDIDDDELHVYHHCDNRACINPEHLFTGSKRRYGERAPNVKLTDEIVTQLRSGALKPSQKLASELGISFSSHLFRVRRGEAWKHLPILQMNKKGTL